MPKFSQKSEHGLEDPHDRPHDLLPGSTQTLSTVIAPYGRSRRVSATSSSAALRTSEPATLIRFIGSKIGLTFRPASHCRVHVFVLPGAKMWRAIVSRAFATKDGQTDLKPGVHSTQLLVEPVHETRVGYVWVSGQPHGHRSLPRDSMRGDPSYPHWIGGAKNAELTLARTFEQYVHSTARSTTEHELGLPSVLSDWTILDHRGFV